MNATASPPKHEQIAIEAEGLTKSFEKRFLFEDLQLTLFAGEIAALMGANGAGKTTLLRCLAAALLPDRGQVIWYGSHFEHDKTAIRRLIGFVAHENRLYPKLTVRENLMFAARMCDISKPGRQVDELLREVGLESAAKLFPRTLSDGMRQRISLLRVLLHKPRIVLLDEPFSGLDAEGCGWFSDVMIDLRQRGRMICFATHDENRAQQLADRVLHLRGGKLVESAIPLTESARWVA